MDYLTANGMHPVHIELQIALSEKNILYPSYLSISCDSFSAGYQLLLIKKNSRELGISKNKYPVFEKPFSLGEGTLFLNGIFDNSKDLKGVPTLTINRLQSKQTMVPIPDTLPLDSMQHLNARSVLDFLKDGEIILTKINSMPWKSDDIDRMLSPGLSPAYFSLLDTVYVPTRDGVIHISDVKKNDIVTVTLNGQVTVDRMALNKKRQHTEDILLDTGLNLLVLFADNFGEGLPNKGKANFEFGHKKFNLDFGKKADSAASFIAAKLYFEMDKEKDIYFKDYFYNSTGVNKLKENEKLLGSILSTSKQLQLAIWDDEVEDGDSISIIINDEWIARGFPVKKSPQFISVVLKPGPNTITFIANNLGSIPPNTSVLEIIDGKKRKSFMLATSLGEYNLIKIFYDLKAE